MTEKVMTKQEEIKEYIKSVLVQMNSEVMLESGRSYDYYLGKILGYLHSQDVVIKLGNRLPEISYNSAYPENEEIYQQAMLKAGYRAVEPLIKESE